MRQAKARCGCLHHITAAEFEKMAPYTQGYVSYMQGEHPGSELKTKQENPYPFESAQYAEFNRGQRASVLAAQDSEG